MEPNNNDKDNNHNTLHIYEHVYTFNIMRNVEFEKAMSAVPEDSHIIQ